MGGRVSLWLLFGLSLAFVAAGAFLLFANRDPGALMPILFFGACAGVFWMQLREGRTRTRDHWPMLEGDTIVLRRGAGTMRVYALLSAMMGLGCGAMVLMDSGPVEKVVGVIGFVFFCGGAAFYVWKRGRDTTALRVDACGIAFDDGPQPKLRWDQLGGVGIVSIHGEKFLGFFAREGVDALAGNGRVVQMAGQVSGSLGYPDFNVAQIGLDVPLEQVAEAIERLRGRYA